MILGGISTVDLAHYKLHDLRLVFNPLHQLQPIHSERLIARKKFNVFFKDQFANTPHMYYEDETQEKDYRVYEADHSLKRKMWRC
jgi:hypothetical protein